MITIHKASPANYSSVTPFNIAYDIQTMAAYIAEKVNPPEGREAMRQELSRCNKTQLKAIAAELETIQKRLDWIIDGKY